MNLCARRWSLPEAREHASQIMKTRRQSIVLLGAKVTRAFGLEYEPFTIGYQFVEKRIVILPHPSGLSRGWNGPDSFQRARRVLANAGIAPFA